MVSKNPAQDRRRAPRLNTIIPLKLCQEDGDIVTETLNISRSGAYCRVSKYIEPMVKMKIHLLLPIKKNGKVSTKKISCNGIIVRTEPIPHQEAYNVAIFFSDITQKDADILADYVSSSLEK